MAFGFTRLALFSALSLGMLPDHALSQTVQPYQSIHTRQLCKAAAILDEPAGVEIATGPAGSAVLIRDLRFGKDGALYYGIDQPAPDGGYIAVADAPNFCGFDERRQSGAARFRATPNSCHLIAASRKTLDEVNAFAAEHADFLPSMSVYRSENGWYAISLGQISLAAAPALLEGARNIPADSYCSDGAIYVAVMDLQDERFVEPGSAGSQDALRLECLTGDGSACGEYSDAIYPESDYVEEDFFNRVRYGLLGCMAGDPLSCERAAQQSGRILNHALVTGLPQSADLFLSQGSDLRRIGCDAGLAEACGRLSGIELARNQGNAAAYLSVLQGEIAACMQQDQYECRDMLALMDERKKLTGKAAADDDLFHAARIWTAFCSHFPDDLDASCRPVYRVYARLLAKPDLLPERAAEMREFLRTGCASRNPEACALYSRLPAAGEQVDREWAAAQASSSCLTLQHVDTICTDLDKTLGPDLAETERLQTAEFDRLAQACEAANTLEGEAACGEALSYYARVISNTELAPVEQLLQRTCRPGHFTGCDSLAFFYSPYTMTGEGLRFQGTHQPDKRLAALRTGCQPGVLGLSNCKDLGEMLAERGDHAAAQESYRMACATSRQSDGATSDLGACFSAGLHALTKLHDPAAARPDFEAVCADNADSNQPYACKHLALLEMERTDAKPDLSRTLDLLEQACFPRGDFKGDGEGCLHYGRTLVENRARLRHEPETGRAVVYAEPPPADEETTVWITHSAARAFVTGCRSRWQAACEANDRFVADWIAAGHPADPSPCQIRGGDGGITSQQTCALIAYARVEPVGEVSDAMIWESVYIWPDGDRTLVKDDGTHLWLNGRSAEAYDGGGLRCLRNPESKRSFCAAWEEGE